MKLAGMATAEKLSNLITLRSTTPPNDVRAVAEALAAFGRDTGAVVALPEVEAGKPNCILTYAFGRGPTLVLNTHMDVNNPAGQQWSFDPFEPFERDGRLYGLGACDAKGSLAAMLGAIEALCGAEQPPTGTLMLTAVMGEEAGGLGTLHLARHGLKADGAIVGEPTELRVCTVHKGTYMRRLTFAGKAVHSARSREGVNAIEHAAAFIDRYAEVSRTLQRTPHPILGPANASVTVIEGGTRQNTIPERCRMIIDRRLLPSETAEKADAELADILDGLKKRIPALDVTVETIVSTVPSETAADARIVRTACAAASAETGAPVSPGGFNGGCDMSKLVRIAGIPTVILGPGSMEQAHAPDEFVSLAQLNTAQRIYERAIRAFVSPEGGGGWTG